MKNALWISMCLPYDNVGHAGGKIHNYYLNRLIDYNKFNVRLISFGTEKDVAQFTLRDKIQADIKVLAMSRIQRIIRGIRNRRWNPFDKYAGYRNTVMAEFIFQNLSKYKQEGYIPDVILIEWTQLVLYAEKIKKFFPACKIIAIEEDVSFLRLQRIYEHTKLFVKGIKYIQYQNLKKCELNALNACDLVITNNPKDEALLRANGYKKTIWTWAPYYDKLNIMQQSTRKDIVFYGTMNRKENQQAAYWIIEKIVPRLKDLDCRVVIMGNDPPSRLKKLSNEKIVVTGFVENPAEYFSTAICSIVPLIYGAGIKIKVIESMFAGIPVITNSVGIEGIMAKEGMDYIYCETVDDYCDAIEYLYVNHQKANEIGENGKNFVINNINYERSAEMFCDQLRAICS